VAGFIGVLDAKKIHDASPERQAMLYASALATPLTKAPPVGWALLDTLASTAISGALAGGALWSILSTQPTPSTDLQAVCFGCVIGSFFFVVKFGYWNGAIDRWLNEMVEIRKTASHWQYQQPAAPDASYEPVGGNLWNRETNTMIIRQAKGKRKAPLSPVNRELQTTARAAVHLDENGHQTAWYDVNRLVWRWAHYITDFSKVDTAESNWIPRSSGKPFDKPEFLALRDWLIKTNQAYWLDSRGYNPGREYNGYRRKGWAVGGRTRAIMRVLASRPYPDDGLLSPAPIHVGYVGDK
jgi:hypothetical protein